MTDSPTAQKKEPPDDKVVPLFSVPSSRTVPPFTDEEILQARQFMAEWAVVRATCPLTIRALSNRR